MNKRQKILIVDDAKFKEERRTLILQSVFFLHISRLKKNILSSPFFFVSFLPASQRAGHFR